MNFIDTNILIYAFGSDDSTTRPEIARSLIAGGRIAFSIQVFQEFYVQATHSRRGDPLTHEEACDVLEQLSAFPVQTNDLQLFRSALGIQQRFQTSFWDANILAAAASLNCESVISEDLNHGQTYGAVTVVNPFV